MPGTIAEEFSFFGSVPRVPYVEVSLAALGLVLIGQKFFRRHFGSDTALVTFDGLYGARIMGMIYPVGSAPIWLERFRPRRGISRYVVAEIQVASPDGQADLERLVERQFGLSPEAWRALPLLDLPRSEYQPAVVARLVVLKGGKAIRPVPARHPHPLNRRRPGPRAEPAPEL